MPKRKFFIILGIWLVLMPLLGIPGSWKVRMTIITGALIFYLSLTGGTRKVLSKRTAGENGGGTFVENGNNDFSAGSLKESNSDNNVF